jgi:hypothetical protein
MTETEFIGSPIVVDEAPREWSAGASLRALGLLVRWPLVIAAVIAWIVVVPILGFVEGVWQRLRP